MNDWRDTTIGDVLTLQRGFDITKKHQQPGNVPVVSSGGISSYHNASSAMGPGVVIGRKGTLGKVFYLENDYWPHDTTLWVKDFKGSWPRFVYYFMTQIDTSWLDGGSANPTLNRNHLHPLKVRWPTAPIQKAIADVLGALDDKIVANTKLINTLDNQMAAEYELAIHDGGRTVQLAEICEFHNKRRVPLSGRERERRPGPIPYYGASGIFGEVDTAIFNEHLVLIGEDGSVIQDDGTPVVQYIWGPSWVNNHAHVLTGSAISTELLYFVIRREQVTGLVTGAVQPKINMGNLKGLEVTLPASEKRHSLEETVNLQTACKRNLVDENKTLSSTRDALLSNLMSGKLRIKDAEALAATAV